MKKLHELGFGAVEVSQIPMTTENVAELKRASEDFNIEIAAIISWFRSNVARCTR